MSKSAGKKCGVGEKSWAQRCAHFSGGLLGFHFISVCLFLYVLDLSFLFLISVSCLKPPSCLLQSFRQGLRSKERTSLHIQCPGLWGSS